MRDFTPKWWLKWQLNIRNSVLFWVVFFCQYQPGMKSLPHKWERFSTCQGKYTRNNYVENDKVQHNNVPCPHADDARLGGDNVQSAAPLQDEQVLNLPVCTCM